MCKFDLTNLIIKPLIMDKLLGPKHPKTVFTLITNTVLINLRSFIASVLEYAEYIVDSMVL